MPSAQNIIEQALKDGQKELSEYQSKLVLAEYGIPIARESVAADLAEAQTAAERIGFPVVLKVCAAGVAHKFEHDLMVLGITDAADLKDAYDRLAPAARNLIIGLPSLIANDRRSRKLQKNDQTSQQIPAGREDVDERQNHKERGKTAKHRTEKKRQQRKHQEGIDQYHQKPIPG